MLGELPLSSIGRSYIQQHLAPNECSGKEGRMLKEQITLMGLPSLWKDVKQLTTDCIFAFTSLLVLMCPTLLFNSAHQTFSISLSRFSNHLSRPPPPHGTSCLHRPASPLGIAE